MQRRTFLSSIGALTAAPVLGASVLGTLLGACGEAESQAVPEALAGTDHAPLVPHHPPPPVTDRLTLGDDEWRRRLTREQYEILRHQRTEPSFSCELWQEHRTGTFYCGGCGNPLFSSAHKFESGTGWASFYQPIERGRVSEHSDVSHGMMRTEVRCARCDGHLGHVFDDGPAPTGLRYCINGSILEFVPA